MPKDKDKKPAKRYKFGARKPTKKVDLIEQLFFWAHCYKNDLAIAELNRRDRVAQARNDMFP